MTYRERPAGVPGAVLWSRTGGSDGSDGVSTILPDGCMDLIRIDGRLVVAGPDTAARTHHDAGTRRHVGLRLGRGLGPWLLGVPADEIRDATPELADLWGSRRAAALAARLDGGDVESELLAWVGGRGAPPDPFGARVAAGLERGLPVTAVAERLGCSTRTLHRRCRPVFGYGPQHLARILRLQRALDAARRGRAWADVAALAGYADQPHLAREVRALTGTTPTGVLAGTQLAGTQLGSQANRSTAEPSGSCTTA